MKLHREGSAHSQQRRLVFFNAHIAIQLNNSILQYLKKKEEKKGQTIKLAERLDILTEKCLSSSLVALLFHFPLKPIIWFRASVHSRSE